MNYDSCQTSFNVDDSTFSASFDVCGMTLKTKYELRKHLTDSTEHDVRPNSALKILRKCYFGFKVSYIPEKKNAVLHVFLCQVSL